MKNSRHQSKHSRHVLHYAKNSPPGFLNGTYLVLFGTFRYVQPALGISTSIFPGNSTASRAKWYFGMSGTSAHAARCVRVQPGAPAAFPLQNPLNIPNFFKSALTMGASQIRFPDYGS
jgi:hypothetical protein